MLESISYAAQLQDINCADSMGHRNVKMLVYERPNLPDVCWKLITGSYDDKSNFGSDCSDWFSANDIKSDIKVDTIRLREVT